MSFKRVHSCINKTTQTVAAAQRCLDKALNGFRWDRHYIQLTGLVALFIAEECHRQPTPLLVFSQAFLLPVQALLPLGAGLTKT